MCHPFQIDRNRKPSFASFQKMQSFLLNNYFEIFVVGARHAKKSSLEANSETLR